MIRLIAVDDELDLKILFEHFFKDEIERRIVDFSFVESAQQCLELLERHQGPALVVTDINMPEVDGLELVQRIYHRFEDIKVFLVSAYELKVDLDHLKKFNVLEYIPKPVNFNSLKRKVLDVSGEKVTL